MEMLYVFIMVGILVSNIAGYLTIKFGLDNICIYTWGTVIYVSGDGSIVETEVKGEIKSFSMKESYPLASVIPIFCYLEDSTCEFGYKYFFPGLLEIFKISSILSAYYLLGHFFEMFNGVWPFSFILLGCFSSFWYGIINLYVVPTTKGNCEELILEHVLDERLEDDTKELYTPVFKCETENEIRFLRGFKYETLGELKKYKKGKFKARYDVVSNEIYMQAEYRTVHFIRFVSIIGILGSVLGASIL